MTRRPNTPATRLPRRPPLPLAAALLLLAAAPGLPAESAAPGGERLPFGAERLADGNLRIGDILVRTKEREIVFPVSFVLQKGVLEVILSTPEGRLHETLLKTEVRPVQVQAMLYLLKCSNGVRVPEKGRRQGDLVDLFLEWQDEDGRRRREPVEDWILDTRTGRPLAPSGWVFTGSPIKDGRFLADEEGNVIINYSIGSTVLDCPDPASAEDDTIHVVNSRRPQPPAACPLRIVLKPRKTRRQ